MWLLLKTPVLCPLEESNVPEVRFHVFDRLWWEGKGRQSRGTYVQTLQLHEGPTCITMATCMNRSNAVVSPLATCEYHSSTRGQKLNNWETWYKMSPGHPSFVYSKQEKEPRNINTICHCHSNGVNNIILVPHCTWTAAWSEPGIFSAPAGLPPSHSSERHSLVCCSADQHSCMCCQWWQK